MKLSIMFVAVLVVGCGKGKEKDSGGGGAAAGGAAAGGAAAGGPACADAATAYVKLMSKSDGYYIGSVKATPEQTKAATALVEADCAKWSAEAKTCITSATDAMKIGKCWKVADTLRVADLLPAFEKAEQAKAGAGSSATP